MNDLKNDLFFRSLPHSQHITLSKFSAGIFSYSKG